MSEIIETATNNDASLTEPNIALARKTAVVAHSLVAKFQEMGLPRELETDLAKLSTDLGDLWSAHEHLASQLKCVVRSDTDWDTIGDNLVDIRSTIDHIAWHINTIRRPMTKITRYAYQASRDKKS